MSATEWSPDGSKIMFCSHWGAGWDVGVMDADGLLQAQGYLA